MKNRRQEQLFRAPEVCELAQLQPYVLRTWESEFPMLGQVPAGGGTRVYRRADVEKVLLIKQLVFSEGLTLAGARRRLEEESLEQPTLAALAMDDMLGEVAKTRLRQVRSGLAAILDMLNRDVNAKSSPRTAAKRRKAS